jgi:hypothetical protein
LKTAFCSWQEFPDCQDLILYINFENILDSRHLWIDVKHDFVETIGSKVSTNIDTFSMDLKQTVDSCQMFSKLPRLD